MFNPIFKWNVQGRKHPGRCTFAEPELLSYRKPKHVVQDKKNGHKNPNNSHNACLCQSIKYDDAIKWKHFPRYWPFVRGIRRSPVNSPHKGQWRGGVMFSLIYAWMNGWVKQSWGWWFETPSRSLWRHSNESTTTNMYIARARCESQPTVKSSGLNARSSKGPAIDFKFLVWSL